MSTNSFVHKQCLVERNSTDFDVKKFSGIRNYYVTYHRKRPKNNGVFLTKNIVKKRYNEKNQMWVI